MPRPVVVLPKILEAIRDYPLLGQKTETEEGAAEVEGRITLALSEYPEHGLPHAAWAWLLARRKQYVDAIESVNRAIELGPESLVPAWYLDRGVYNSFLGHWMLSISDLTTHCRLWPDEAGGHMMRSMEFKKLGDGLCSAMEEQFALHFGGQLTLDQLCEFIHSFPFYASPERLEATFMVMCEPLSWQARVHRAELMLLLGVPTAAYHDYQVAGEIERRNLGILARLEEIRQQGLLVDPPLITLEKPKIELWPIYQQVMDQYRQSFEAVKQFKVGEEPTWKERVFGRVKSRLKYNNHQAGLWFIAFGMLISAISSSYAHSLQSMINFVGFNRFPEGFAKPAQYVEWVRISSFLAAIAGITNIYGIYLSIHGAFRLIRGTREKDRNEPVEVFDYILGFVMFAVFAIASQAPLGLFLVLLSRLNTN